MLSNTSLKRRVLQLLYNSLLDTMQLVSYILYLKNSVGFTQAEIYKRYLQHFDVYDFLMNYNKEVLAVCVGRADTSCLIVDYENFKQRHETSEAEFECVILDRDDYSRLEYFFGQTSRYCTQLQ